MLNIQDNSNIGNEKVRDGLLVGGVSKITRDLCFSGILMSSPLLLGYQQGEQIDRTILALKDRTELGQQPFLNESYRNFILQWGLLQSNIRIVFYSGFKVNVEKSEICLPLNSRMEDIPVFIGNIRSSFGLPERKITYKSSKDIEREFLYLFLDYGKKQIFEQATSFSQEDKTRTLEEFKKRHAWQGSGLSQALKREENKYEEDLDNKAMNLWNKINWDGLYEKLQIARKAGIQEDIFKYESLALGRIFTEVYKYPWIEDSEFATSTLSRNIIQKHLNCNGKGAFMIVYLEKLGIKHEILEVMSASAIQTHQALWITMSNGKQLYVDPTYGNIQNIGKIKPTQHGSFWKYAGLNDPVGQTGEDYVCVHNPEKGLINAQLQNFARYYYSRGFFNEAKEVYEKSMQLTGANNHFGIAQCCMRLGKKREAIRHYKLAKKHFPENTAIDRLIQDAEN